MSDVAAIITAVFSGVATLLGVYLTYLITRMKVQQKISNALVDETLQVSKVIHTLVNNDTHVALKIIADLLEEKALRTGLAADRVAADKAKEKLAHHDAQQNIVDQEKEGKEQLKPPEKD